MKRDLTLMKPAELAKLQQDVFSSIGASSYAGNLIDILDNMIETNQKTMFAERDQNMVNRIIGANYTLLEIRNKVQEAQAGSRGSANPKEPVGPLM